MLRQEREKYERKLDLVRELKQKSDALEADIRDLEEERDEWKQACKKAEIDRDDWQKVYNSLPVTKRISELCSKVAVQSAQITDLTTELDSYRSMYQSSQDINAGLAKEHNDLKAAYERIACSQPTPAEHLTSQMSKLISSMNEAGAAAVKPDPGRLEIAAMVWVGMLQDPDSWEMDYEDSAKHAIEVAAELIKADKQQP
jgi:hypothetical protein